MLACAAALLAGCGEQRSERLPATGEPVAGAIAVDGSRTPVAAFRAVAGERFRRAQPGVRMAVRVADPGAALERLCSGETEIAEADRPIDPDEIATCRDHEVRYVELPVAHDGAAVVAARTGDAPDCLTTDRLRTLARDGRLPGAPGALGVFAASLGDGLATGGPGASDGAVADALADSPDGLGYVPFAAFAGRRDRLRPLSVDAGNGCVPPSEAAIQTGAYKPLARPLYLYASERALRRPAVGAFLRFALANERELAAAAGVVALSRDQLVQAREALAR